MACFVAGKGDTLQFYLVPSPSHSVVTCESMRMQSVSCNRVLSVGRTRNFRLHEIPLKTYYIYILLKTGLGILDF